MASWFLLRAAALLVGLAAIGTATACTRLASEFTCGTSAECALDGTAGTCEPSGFCSFDDEGCPSGRRYAPHASVALAGTCVASGGIVDGGGGDAAGPDGAVDPCAGGDQTFVAATGRCYLRVEAALASRPAGSRCADEAKVPAILSAPGELDEVRAALLTTDLGPSVYHLGLYHAGGSYRWADGTQPTSLPWGSGEPSSSLAGDVAMFAHAPGGTFVLDATPATTPGGVLCEDPVTGVRGASEYVVFHGHFQEADPAAACVALGGTLATVTSDEENLFVGELVGAGVNVLIGLGDRAVEGSYAWPTGEPYGYEDWGGGEPNDDAATADEDCTYLVGGAGPSWFDASCAQGADGFICERRLP